MVSVYFVASAVPLIILDVCMNFEVLGENLLTVIRKAGKHGVSLKRVKRITYQVAKGLQYLHDVCGIIHTDLKPEV